MSHKLTLELPDELYEPLVKAARQEEQPIEEAPPCAKPHGSGAMSVLFPNRDVPRHGGFCRRHRKHERAEEI